MAVATYAARYVSNAGLVLEMAGERIGIDIFSKDPLGLYPDPLPWLREELLEEIEAGTMTVLIFTHGHGDHFCREDVIEAWKRNPHIRIISTEQVARRLWKAEIPGGQLGTCMSIEELQPGVWAIPDGEKEKCLCAIEMKHARICFLNTIHEGEQYKQVQNLTLFLNIFLQKYDEVDVTEKMVAEAKGKTEAEGKMDFQPAMELDGKLNDTWHRQSWVVAGDAAPKESLFEKIAEWSKTVDWFFLPFPYVGIRTTRKMLKKELDLQNAFVLHAPRPEADEQNWLASAKRMCEKSKDGLPMPVFPERLGDWFDLTNEE